MMGAVFSEMAGDGAGRRRFATTRTAGPSRAPRSTSPRAYEGTAAEHAARIIALVVADNPIPGRKAV